MRPLRQSVWLALWPAMVLSAAGAVAADTRALVVAGLGGSDAYESAFQHQARTVADGLRALSGDVTLLLGGMAGRDRCADELAALGARAEAGDTLLLVLIGHGSYDDRHYRFNVPGPDPTGEDLARWLDAWPVQRQLVVAATSASGALQPLLAQPQRTVMTATRSGAENNASVFAEHFAAALADSGADLDKDGYVSAEEAFAYAENRVGVHYATAGSMATEHPLSAGPRATARLARLDAAPAFAAGGGAGAGRIAELQAAIEALRADKDSRDSDSYYAELQRLLIELALARRGDVP
ncbi:MAG: hypothetical protein RIC56_22610 [Pseudomonadales bacterium]